MSIVIISFFVLFHLELELSDLIVLLADFGSDVGFLVLDVVADYAFEVMTLLLFNVIFVLRFSFFKAS
jgi:hypothetical protein